MPSVTFFHIDEEGIQADKNKLEQRYKRGNTVDGTRSFHHFCSSAVGSVRHIEEQHMMNSQLEHAVSLCLLGFILIRTFQLAVMLHARMTAIGGLV